MMTQEQYDKHLSSLDDFRKARTEGKVEDQFREPMFMSSELQFTREQHKELYFHINSALMQLKFPPHILTKEDDKWIFHVMEHLWQIQSMLEAEGKRHKMMLSELCDRPGTRNWDWGCKKKENHFDQK